MAEPIEQKLALETFPRHLGGERYFSQHDERWSRRPYTVRDDAAQTIASSGCMPCRQAVIVSTLTNVEITPDIMAAFNLANGFRTSDNGTLHRALFALDEFGGIPTFEVSREEIEDILTLGGMVTVSGRLTPDMPQHLPGTLTGHIYGLRRVEGDRVWVNDPDDIAASRMPHSLAQLAPSFSRLYASFPPAGQTR